MGKKRGSSGTHHFEPALVDDRERAVSDEVLGGVLVDADRLHPESVRGRAGRGDVSGHGAALSITGGGLAQDICLTFSCHLYRTDSSLLPRCVCARNECERG